VFYLKRKETWTVQSSNAIDTVYAGVFGHETVTVESISAVPWKQSWPVHWFSYETRKTPPDSIQMHREEGIPDEFSGYTAANGGIKPDSGPLNNPRQQQAEF